MRSVARPPRFRGDFHTDSTAREAAASASGILRSTPQAVAVPLDAADVAALVRWAAATSTALVPRGAGTGMPGGNVGAGIAVDLLREFRAVGPVDPVACLATVQPGATRGELNRVGAPFDLHLPVDPSSGNRCTLGGMIANNSAGAHSVRYGAMRRWVYALDLVLATGEQARLERGRAPESAALRQILQRIEETVRPCAAMIRERWPKTAKNSSGYALKEYLDTGDALDLLVGSEGTLALVVGAEIELAPLPTGRSLALLEFSELEAAGAAVQRIVALGPAACEIFDRTFLDLVRAGGADTAYPLRPGLEALLLVEFEGDAEQTGRALEQLHAVATPLATRIAVAEHPRDQAELWEIRHAASPLIAARGDGRISMQFIEDGVVPVAQLPAYIHALRETLARHGLPAVIFGHAGDGNLHVNPLVDVRATGWRESIEATLQETAVRVAELGGTLAGEHGDGRLRAPLLETIWGAEMVRLFRSVKAAWDPAGILNPGVILPLPGQRPLDALRDFATSADTGA